MRTGHGVRISPWRIPTRPDRRIVMRRRAYRVDLVVCVGLLTARVWLRTILAMVLIVAILPWGAFTAQFPGAVKPAAELSMASVVSDIAGPKYRYVKAAKRCKGSALPGSPCGPQTIIGVSVSVVVPPPSSSEARFARANTRLNGTFDETAFDPPILG